MSVLETKSLSEICSKTTNFLEYELRPLWGKSTRLIQMQVKRFLVLSECFMCAKNQIPEWKLSEIIELQTHIQTDRPDRLLHSCYPVGGYYFNRVHFIGTCQITSAAVWTLDYGECTESLDCAIYARLVMSTLFKRHWFHTWLIHVILYPSA